MAVTVANKLDVEYESRMREFAATLSENDGRRFAAFEARQQGYGGIEYIARIIGCSRLTIERGMAELDHRDQDSAAGQLRRLGAGQKKTISPDSEVKQNLKSLLETRTAGDQLNSILDLIVISRKSSDERVS